MSCEGHSGRYVWYVIGLLAVVNVFNSADRIALAVLSPLVKSDLQLSDTQLGLAIGLAFSLFYAVCGIPIARWADRGVRRDIIAVALVTWSVMTALSGAAQNFWQLLLTRVGVGSGEAGCLAPGQSMICDYVPLQQRAGAFGIQTFGLYAGLVLGMIVVSWLGERIGWRWTFVALGVPGIALALLVRLTLREPVRGFFDVPGQDRGALPFWITIRTIWSCRTYRLLVLFLVVNGFVVSGLVQWWPSFYARVFELKLATVGVYLGLAIGAGSGIGTVVGGFLANRAARRNPKYPLVLSAAATSLALPGALGSLLVPSASASIVLLSMTVLCWSMPIGAVTMAKVSVVNAGVRATAAAVAIFVSSAIGGAFGPFFVGLLSDVLAPSFGTEALRYAMLAPACALPVMVASLYAAGRALPADLRSAAEPSVSHREHRREPLLTMAAK